MSTFTKDQLNSVLTHELSRFIGSEINEENIDFIKKEINSYLDDLLENTFISVPSTDALDAMN